MNDARTYASWKRTGKRMQFAGSILPIDSVILHLVAGHLYNDGTGGCGIVGRAGHCLGNLLKNGSTEPNNGVQGQAHLEKDDVVVGGTKGLFDLVTQNEIQEVATASGDHRAPGS